MKERLCTKCNGIIRSMLLLMSLSAATVTCINAEDAIDMVMIPKFELSVFDQAHSGAIEAHEKIENKGNFDYLAPPSASFSGTNQIEFVSSVTRNSAGAIMLSNNADDDIARACAAAADEGTHVITWDSPIPSGKAGGETLFIAQVDFDQTGVTMADMASRILGFGGGKVGILSAAAVSANQNQWIASMQETLANNPGKYAGIEIIDIVYGDDDPVVSDEAARNLINTYPDMTLIMAPTTVGIVAAAKVVSELGLCERVKVSGLGLPSEMLDATLEGCVPEFALWSFVDLGYLSYYAAYLIATGQLVAEDGQTFEAGRMGSFTIRKDPTRPDVDALRVLMGDFTVYNKNNIEAAALKDLMTGSGDQMSFEERYIRKYKKKALAIIPKVTGMISFVSSSFIVIHTLRNPRLRKLTLNRLLVGISFNDMISSFFGFFLSTWPTPSDTWLVFGNVGNMRTCTMQGFFFQGASASAPLYMAGLTTFYVLTIVAQWSAEFVEQKVERYLHIIPFVVGWGTALIGLPLKLYNPADRIGFICWIAEYPPYCSLRDNCERGNHANTFRWAFLYGIVLFVLVYLMITMILIHRTILFAEKATDRWTKAAGQKKRRTNSKKVASQGRRYIAAFFFPWVFSITINLLNNRMYVNMVAADDTLDNALTWLELCNALIFPLKGFFNLLVFMGPRSTDNGNRVTSSTSKNKNTAQNSNANNSRNFSGDDSYNNTANKSSHFGTGNQSFYNPASTHFNSGHRESFSTRMSFTGARGITGFSDDAMSNKKSDKSEVSEDIIKPTLKVEQFHDENVSPSTTLNKTEDKPVYKPEFKQKDTWRESEGGESNLQQQSNNILKQYNGGLVTTENNERVGGMEIVTPNSSSTITTNMSNTDQGATTGKELLPKKLSEEGKNSLLQSNLEQFVDEDEKEESIIASAKIPIPINNLQSHEQFLDEDEKEEGAAGLTPSPGKLQGQVPNTLFNANPTHSMNFMDLNLKHNFVDLNSKQFFMDPTRNQNFMDVMHSPNFVDLNFNQNFLDLNHNQNFLDFNYNQNILGPNYSQNFMDLNQNQNFMDLNQNKKFMDLHQNQNFADLNDNHNFTGLHQNQRIAGHSYNHSLMDPNYNYNTVDPSHNQNFAADMLDNQNFMADMLEDEKQKLNEEKRALERQVQNIKAMILDKVRHDKDTLMNMLMEKLRLEEECFLT